MKLLSLLMWVGQFGFSVLFPTVFFLLLGVWLQTRFGLGLWVLIVCGILGLLTTVSTVKACIHSLCKAAEEAGGTGPRPVSFNDHK